MRKKENLFGSKTSEKDTVYEIKVDPKADKVFSKLDNSILKVINKKIEDIKRNPFHKYKFLKNKLKGLNRVHVRKHFVLIFKIDHENKLVILYDFDHHNKIYKKRKNGSRFPEPNRRGV